jgi:hypothetical protein
MMWAGKAHRPAGEHCPYGSPGLNTLQDGVRTGDADRQSPGDGPICQAATARTTTDDFGSRSRSWGGAAEVGAAGKSASQNPDSTCTPTTSPPDAPSHLRRGMQDALFSKPRNLGFDAALGNTSGGAGASHFTFTAGTIDKLFAKPGGMAARRCSSRRTSAQIAGHLRLGQATCRPTGIVAERCSSTSSSNDTRSRYRPSHALAHVGAGQQHLSAGATGQLPPGLLERPAPRLNVHPVLALAPGNIMQLARLLPGASPAASRARPTSQVSAQDEFKVTPTRRWIASPFPGVLALVPAGGERHHRAGGDKRLPLHFDRTQPQALLLPGHAIPNLQHPLRQDPSSSSRTRALTYPVQPSWTRLNSQVRCVSTCMTPSSHAQ